MAKAKIDVKSERQRILDEMAVCDPADKRYEVLQERLNNLHDTKSKIDWNGIAQAGIKAAGPLLLGALIISFEKHGGAFVSQASKFIRF